MLVVVDTNALLVSISDRSKFHWLYKVTIEKKIRIAITNEILTEYEEQIAFHWHPEVAINVIRSLLELPTTLRAIIYFNLHLIENDEDDNKFVDCAFASNSDHIISNDKDFNILKSISFPSLNVLSIEQFKEVLLNKGII
ncbi:MAG: putative toxin-antitoxin system toxin component, family [Segetibacter sp.]|nr:putative toxin-antitoxin system toxin component, family [Segetibacter sp.]